MLFTYKSFVDLLKLWDQNLEPLKNLTNELDELI